jgi:hypothetical protein
MYGHKEHGELGVVQLPSPTAMPIVLALGVALMLTGLVTNFFNPDCRGGSPNH